MKTAFCITAAIVAVLVLCPGSVMAQRRSYQVACYSGTTHSYVGTIASVFDATRSAGICNTVFNECENNCTGCFMNIDNKQVCYTSSGEVFSD